MAETGSSPQVIIQQQHTIIMSSAVVTPPAQQRLILLMNVPGVIYGMLTRQARHRTIIRAPLPTEIVKVLMTSTIMDLILITLHSSFHYIRYPSTGYHPFLSSSINLSISTFYFILATTTIWAHPAGTASPIVAPPQHQQSAHEVSNIIHHHQQPINPTIIFGIFFL